MYSTEGYPVLLAFAENSSNTGVFQKHYNLAKMRMYNIYQEVSSREREREVYNIREEESFGYKARIVCICVCAGTSRIITV